MFFHNYLTLRRYVNWVDVENSFSRSIYHTPKITFVCKVCYNHAGKRKD